MVHQIRIRCVTIKNTRIGSLYINMLRGEIPFIHLKGSFAASCYPVLFTATSKSTTPTIPQTGHSQKYLIKKGGGAKRGEESMEFLKSIEKKGRMQKKKGRKKGRIEKNSFVLLQVFE